jgi:hypothetical protein
VGSETPVNLQLPEALAKVNKLLPAVIFEICVEPSEVKSREF